jgi:hypothetical protein
MATKVEMDLKPVREDGQRKGRAEVGMRKLRLPAIRDRWPEQMPAGWISRLMFISD